MVPSLYNNIISVRYHLILLICLLTILSAKPGSISLGLNDNMGFFGGLSKSWITEKDYGETYTIVGTTLLLTGGVGYGHKYYISKGIFSPYASLTGFGYYLLAINAIGGLAVSANLGVDINIISWNKYTIMLQCGLFTAYDIFTGRSIIIPASDGPSFLMPSFNIKIRFD